VNMIDREMTPRLTFKAIRRWVSVRSGIPLELIEGRGRMAPIVTARWQAFWLTKRLLGYENTRIAHLVGKDDTSIQYALDKLEGVQTNLDDLATECANDLQMNNN
jgi:chromosomal replication initiation ATPase DnaA